MDPGHMTQSNESGFRRACFVQWSPVWRLDSSRASVLAAAEPSGRPRQDTVRHRFSAQDRQRLQRSTPASVLLVARTFRRGRPLSRWCRAELADGVVPAHSREGRTRKARFTREDSWEMVQVWFREHRTPVSPVPRSKSGRCVSCVGHIQGQGLGQAEPATVHGAAFLCVTG